jgi:hypothetical protein
MNREVSNSVYKESLTTRDLELIRHNINRNRLNTMPATPKNIAEVHEAVSSMNIVTDRKERFLLLNDITNNISSLFNEFVCNLGFFGMSGQFKTRVKREFLRSTSAKKSPNYTRTS